MARRRTGSIETRDGRLYAKVSVTLTDGRTMRRRVRLPDGLTKRQALREAKRLGEEASAYSSDPRRPGVVREMRELYGDGGAHR